MNRRHRHRSIFSVMQTRKVQKGEIRGSVTRLDKLCTLFTRSGNKLSVINAIINLRIKIKESFKPISSGVFLENLLERLEPLFDLRKPVTKSRAGRRNKLKGKQAELVVYPCSIKRRTYLGLRFFKKAVQLRQKKYQIKLKTAIFQEVRAIHLGLRCFSFDLKREHILKIFSIKDPKKDKRPFAA